MSPAARRRARRIVRISLRIGAALLVLAIVLAGAALGAMHTAWGRDQLRGKVEAALDDVFEGDVRVRRLEGSVLGEIVLHDVEIDDPDGRTAITIATLRLDVGITPLLGSELRIHSAVADGVVIDARRTPDGVLNLANLMTTPAEPSQWDIRLEDVIVRGEITFVDDVPGGMVTHLDAFEIGGSFWVPRQGNTTATVALSARWRERGLPLSFDADVTSGLTETHVASANAALGDLRATATELRIVDGTYQGNVTLDVTAATLATFIPSPLAGDVHVGVVLEPIETGTSLAIDGTIGSAPLHGVLVLTPETRRIAGTVQLQDADLSAIVAGAPDSELDAMVTIDLALDAGQHGIESPRGQVVLAASGRVERVRAQSFTATIDVDDARAQVRADARGAGGLVVHLDATGAIGDHVVLERAHLVASARDIEPAARAFLPTASGSLAVDLTATGSFDDELQLAVEGTIDGTALAYDVDRVRDLHVDIDATGLPSHPAGAVRVVARGVVHDDVKLGEIRIDARSRPDGQLAVSVRSDPPRAPWRADVDAVIALDVPHQSARIALGKHRIRTNGVDWFGKGGVVTITPARIAVAAIRTNIAGGHLAVDGSLRRASGDFDARVQLDGVDLTDVDQSIDLPDPWRGRVDGRVSVSKRGHAWSGAVGGKVSNLVLKEGGPPIDASLEATLAPGRIVIDGTLSGDRVGVITVAFDLQPPRHLEDPVAWTQLPIDRIQKGTVTMVALDVAGLAAVVGVTPPVTGRIDADFTVSAEHTHGFIHARGIANERLPEPIDADIEVHNHEVGIATIDAQVSMRQIATAHGTATLQIPVRLFDVDAWLATDADQVRGASLTVADVILDKRRSRLLGLTDTWKGRGNLRVDVAPGLVGATAVLELHDLQGGPVARPIGARVELVADGHSMKATVLGSLRGATVLNGTGSVPVGLDDLWRRGVGVAEDAPLEVTARIEPTPLVDVLAALGQPDRVLGTVSGDITVAGTVSAPTGTAKLALSGAGVRTRTIRRLTLDGTWDGTTAVARVRGEEIDGGELDLDASVEPRDLSTAAVKLVARDFDVAPLFKLGPMELRGVSGVLDGHLTARDATARSTTISGRLAIKGATLPLGDQVGTMRDGEIVLASSGGKLTLRVDGKVGAGTVRVRGEAAVNGLIPRSASVEVRVKGVTLIGEIATRLNGKLTAELRKDGDRWIVDATVRNAKVFAPKESGTPLHETGAPDDMITIIDGRPPPAVAASQRPWSALLGTRPTRAFAIVNLDIGPTQVRTPEMRGRVQGDLTITIGDDGVAIDGEVKATQGAVALFDRTYRIDRGAVLFDGTLDPRLDVHLVHEFPEITLYVEVKGPVSKPEVHLSSRPATYTEGQLFSFLLGGNPGLQPGQEVQQAATGIASSLVSSKIGGFVGKYLPVQVDVLRFEAGTTASSAAFTVGKWVTRRLFVAYRRRVESRPDENTGEAEIEYWLTPGIIVQGSTGDRGHHDADLLWIKRW